MGYGELLEAPAPAASTNDFLPSSRGTPLRAARVFVERLAIREATAAHGGPMLNLNAVEPAENAMLYLGDGALSPAVAPTGALATRGPPGTARYPGALAAALALAARKEGLAMGHRPAVAPTGTLATRGLSGAGLWHPEEVANVRVPGQDALNPRPVTTRERRRKTWRWTPRGRAWSPKRALGGLRVRGRGTLRGGTRVCVCCVWLPPPGKFLVALGP